MHVWKFFVCDCIVTRQTLTEARNSFLGTMGLNMACTCDVMWFDIIPFYSIDRHGR